MPSVGINSRGEKVVSPRIDPTPAGQSTALGRRKYYGKRGYGITFNKSKDLRNQSRSQKEEGGKKNRALSFRGWKDTEAVTAPTSGRQSLVQRHQGGRGLKEGSLGFQK